MKKTKEWLHDGTLYILGGVLLGVFALFATLSSVSYLFSWKTDQSLADVASFFDGSVSVANYAGGAGSSLGRFLVGDCFGLAALLLCVFMFSASWRLIRGKDTDWIRLALLAVFGTFSLAMLLAYVSDLFGAPLSNLFGGGLGGGACAFLLAGMNVLFGRIISLVIILAVPVMLFLILSDSAAAKVRAAGREELPQDEPEVEPAQVETDPFIDDIPDVAVAEQPEVFVPESAVHGPVFGGAAETAPVLPDPVDFDDQAQGGKVDNFDAEVRIEGPQEEISTEFDEELPQLDIRSDVDRYEFPSLDLLEDYADKRYTIPQSEIERNTEKIKATLASFKIPMDSITASVGYTVTLYRIVLGEGVRVNTIRNIEDDIAIRIGIKGVRVVMLSDAVGIEVPNDRPSVVPLKAILNSDSFRKSKAELPIAVGYTITTKAKVFDLADAPHLLVAGATKQGKSVGLNAIISSLLYCKHPTELKFVFIDPKMVEFQKYGKLLDHYLAILPAAGDETEAKNAIVTDPKNAEAVLSSLCVEMDERYKLMSSAGENKITDYNEKFRNRHLLPTEGHHFMPYLVVVVDEYADLTKSLFGSDRNLSRSIENSINRLAAKGRAAGIHVIIATQRPSVDVITGTIKGNFPTRMAFRTAQRQDSQTILGMPGAERLIGKGDMLFFTGAEAERVQCALVDTDEIERLTSFIAAQQGYHQRCVTPYYLPEPVNPDGTSASGDVPMIDMKNVDPMFEEAARLAVMNQQISTSLVQRKLQLGFARAGRVMDQLEAAGVVGPQNGSKSREVLVPDLASLQSILDAYLK